jgi:hypothetical protein
MNHLIRFYQAFKLIKVQPMILDNFIFKNLNLHSVIFGLLIPIANENLLNITGDFLKLINLIHDLDLGFGIDDPKPSILPTIIDLLNFVQIRFLVHVDFKDCINMSQSVLSLDDFNVRLLNLVIRVQFIRERLFKRLSE